MSPSYRKTLFSRSNSRPPGCSAPSELRFAFLAGTFGRSNPGLVVAAAVLVLLGAAPASAQQQFDDPSQQQSDDPSGFDLDALQGILAIQQLDGWLLYDYQQQNPIAGELVDPRGKPARRWFYLIPARGKPVALVHTTDVSSFEHVPGRRVVYETHGQFAKGLAKVLKGRKRLAMEYSPMAALPSLSRVDAGTIELVRSSGVTVRSSAELVQFTKALWGPEGRLTHYVAAHHLDELRKKALDFVARRIRGGETVTESDVQQLIAHGYQIRGLVGPPPVVAAGKHTADPNHESSQDSIIEKGALLLIAMAVKVDKGKRAIYAQTTWMAYVGASVPGNYTEVFEVVTRARDAALDLLRDRVRRRRAVKGFEVDRRARTVIDKAGHADKFVHPTGHSLDTDVRGAGGNLDDYETRDTRNLVAGSGFSIAPGIYLKAEFGMRAEINVYLGRTGVEVTTSRQEAITAILADE
ncbi:MAG: M24 family metallopeptidase [Proteobacteria bacterium]|nr:M24 family metallopeptidase [Pseudomonadota bacterium]